VRRGNPLGEGLFGLPPGEDPFAHRGSTPQQAGQFKVGAQVWWRDSGRKAGRIFKLLPYGHPNAIGPKKVRAAYVERQGRMTPIALMLLQPHGGPGLHHTFPRQNPGGRRYLGLEDIYESLPERDEGIWQHVDQDEFEGALYRVVELDPRRVASWLTPRGDTTVAQAFKDFATKAQKKIVKHYMGPGLKDAKEGYLVVYLDDEELVDGHHRVIALAKKKATKVRALDLGDEWSWEKGCVLCGGPTDDYECGSCEGPRQNPQGDRRLRELERRYLATRDPQAGIAAARGYSAAHMEDDAVRLLQDMGFKYRGFGDDSEFEDGHELWTHPVHGNFLLWVGEEEEEDPGPGCTHHGRVSEGPYQWHCPDCGSDIKPCEVCGGPWSEHWHNCLAYEEGVQVLHNPPRALAQLRKAVGRGRECYPAAEVLYHDAGGRRAGLTPMQQRHEGRSHWWVRGPKGEAWDPAAAQFRRPVPYSKGRGRGFLTARPSKRARALARRAGVRLNPGPNPVTRMLLDAPTRLGCTPYEINDGLCIDVAEAIDRAVPGAQELALPVASILPGHAWIYYQGKHYDAEAPYGVDHYLDLPIFRKWIEAHPGAFLEPWVDFFGPRSNPDEARRRLQRAAATGDPDAQLRLDVLSVKEGTFSLGEPLAKIKRVVKAILTPQEIRRLARGQDLRDAYPWKELAAYLQEAPLGLESHQRRRRRAYKPQYDPGAAHAARWLDELRVGTPLYGGVGYFWNTEYKHTLRELPWPARKAVHDTWLKHGLELDGRSGDHLVLMEQVLRIPAGWHWEGGDLVRGSSHAGDLQVRKGSYWRRPKVLPNPDVNLRELERAAKAGDTDARVQLARAKIRHGRKSWDDDIWAMDEDTLAKAAQAGIRSSEENVRKRRLGGSSGYSSAITKIALARGVLGPWWLARLADLRRCGKIIWDLSGRGDHDWDHEDFDCWLPVAREWQYK
jgi:TPR repeat protein